LTNRDPRTDRPKTNADPIELARKRALLRESHVAPLTEFVERLRAAEGAVVPWFDPTEGGVSARILLLLEAPGRKAALVAEGGSSFVSPDNNDRPRTCGSCSKRPRLIGARSSRGT
jgi:uracil-DNA glycosylase